MQIFQDQSRSSSFEDIKKLTPEKKLKLAKECYQLSRYIFSPVLVSSMETTFTNIHSALEHLFFGEIHLASQRLQDEPEVWQNKLDTLREFPLFAESSDFDLMRISGDMEEKQYKTGEPFLVENKPVTGVFLLKEQANVFVEGKETPILTRSGIFGEEACATDVMDASATVSPVKDCTIFYIPREKFLIHTMRIPGLQARVFQMIIDRSKYQQKIAQESKERAEEQRKLTQEILDHIGQGSFSINQAGEIGNYSAVAKDYLGRRNLAGAPFADIVFRKNRTALKEYYRALHMLFGGNQFDPDVILSMLPTEVTIKKRIFKLSYFFVQDANGYVLSVFVRMAEVTLERQLAAKEEQEKLILDKMRQNIGGFLNMLDDLKNSFSLMEEFLENYVEAGQQPDSEFISGAMRTLHGSKGLSGQFEFNNLKTVVHKLEDCLRNIDDKQELERYTDKFFKLFMEFETEYNYALSFKENLGIEIVQILEGVSFSQSEFQSLLKAATERDFEQMRPLVLRKASVPAEKIVDNWENDILRLAERLEKQIEFQLDVQEDLLVPTEIAKSLNVVLGHIYRNSIDHGIETPERRAEAGKNMTGVIAVKMYLEDNHLMIVLKDDGAGLNNEKIAKIAKSKSHLDQILVDKYIAGEKFWKILFMPGFSSAEQVTQISGRGVGMDAVQNTINKLNGKIVMASEQGKGSVFLISIPLDASRII
ncbi:MAG: hypothetical protein HQM14_17260 [SAR324 cluster bacterium]|nr:hypothetical protein [SAR324 cluster bacterium]